MEGNPRKRPALEVGGLYVERTRTREEGFSRERVMSSALSGKTPVASAKDLLIELPIVSVRDFK